eukprot:COSAG02_NODE_1980_length_10197_cov_40.403842_2_plen_63_part_00
MQAKMLSHVPVHFGGMLSSSRAQPNTVSSEGVLCAELPAHPRTQNGRGLDLPLEMSVSRSIQ